MTFVQMIDCKTDRVEELNRLLDIWVEQTRGKRTATHNVLAQDRSDGTHVVEIVEFPSYEDAMRNSNLPETDRIFQEMVALCDGMPTFTDLEVIRDEQLHKEVCARFFTEALTGDPGLLDGLLTRDYHDHDPANFPDVIGVEALRGEIAAWRDAFDYTFTLEDQIAEGDRVCTRWTWEGTHKGEFLGLAPTGRRVSMTGTTVHRLHEGLICESWWQYDRLGLMGRLGAPES
ncbi:MULTISPECIES: ester cyclase [unclassified Streptomyces]|uniref:ester cyclase n=1 Tax=unclassified Streptomyces TaxID=2593676 RepID=UPI000F44BB88|nr:ester cyclase [Streptomyces sp. I6]RNL72391.1 ester cyclase [Streptomyces sp. I6]